jgi:hypothetical protein
MTGCQKSGAAVGFALFPPSKMRSTNETLQPAHAKKDTEYIRCFKQDKHNRRLPK